MAVVVLIFTLILIDTYFYFCMIEAKAGAKSVINVRSNGMFI